MFFSAQIQQTSDGDEWAGGVSLGHLRQNEHKYPGTPGCTHQGGLTG